MALVLHSLCSMTRRHPDDIGPECPDCGSVDYVFVATRGHKARVECEHCRLTFHVRLEDIPADELDETSYRRYR